MTISYTRTFVHTDWVDNVDRVQAGGGNGFNGRFHDLEAEFDTISGVVKQIVAGGVPSTVCVAPMLIAIGASANSTVTGWDVTTTPGIAVKPRGATEAHGMLPVMLPVGATIVSFKAVGQNAGSDAGAAKGTLTVELKRQSLEAAVPVAPTGLTPKEQKSVVTIMVKGDARSTSFEAPGVPVSGEDRVDGQSSYFIVARITAAGGGDFVTLINFQVLCLL